MREVILCRNVLEGALFEGGGNGTLGLISECRPMDCGT